MEKDCIRLTSEEKERLIEFKKSDKFLKAYKQIKEEIGLEELNQEIRDTVGIFYQLSM